MKKKLVSKQTVIKKQTLDWGRFFIGKEKDFFIENLAMLVNSGMAIDLALKSIGQEVKSRWLKKMVQRVLIRIEGGSSIYKALATEKFLDSHYLSLIRIGEESGQLKENLKVIVQQQQKERSFKDKIRSAMMYPVFVLSLTLIIGVGIAWFILPKLSAVFSSLDLELPLVTKALIGLGNYLGQYGTLAVPIFLAVLFLVIFLLFGFPKTKFIGQKILFVIPGVKKLIQEVELARFGFLLGTLLEASLPVVPSLDSLSQTTVLKDYQRFYKYLKVSINEGNSFRKSFAAYKKSKKIIPSSIQQIVVTAEQSGNLPEALLKIGSMFEEKTENTTKNLAVILEPILLVIVWLGVVAVALAVILPIYSLVGGLNRTSVTQSKPAPVIQKMPEQVAEEIQSSKEEQLSNSEPQFLGSLIILPTGIGYLNVRSEAGLEGEIITTVNPREEFDYQQEKDGWYKILLNLSEETAISTSTNASDLNTGWVFGEYVEIIEQDE